VDLLERSLAADPRNVATYCLRGNLHLQQQNFEAALGEYDGALGLKPKFFEALSGKAAALVGLGRLDDAIAATVAAAEAAPKDALTRRNLALLLRQSGQPQAALSAARTALQLSPEADQPGLERLVAALEAESATRTPSP
jgi:tetratricopeptide (TPR) repeat protein